MSRIYRLIFTLFLLLGVHTLAYASEKQSEARAELLYATHCTACHTSQVHWREQKLVSDWSSLVTQVRRWQSISGLNWSESEIADVAYYLNAVYYKFKNTVPGKNAKQILLQD